ncbi:MAG: glutathione S-transferase family protein [Solirubrobacteraceae bacterium]
MPEPRLWSWKLSPFAAKARIAFAEKGVPVDLIEIHPVERPERLRELNPSNRVPVLEVDGVAIRESTPICEWLEDAYPERPLWPAEPARRARARGLLRWVDDELTVNFFLSMRKEAFGIDPTDHPDAVAILRERLARRWAPLEDLLGRDEGDWLVYGEQPTLADLAAIPLAVRLPEWKPELMPDLATYPRSTAWLRRLRERPTAAEVDRSGKPALAD